LDRKLKIFVSHPSPCLTDHLSHGDGLVAWEYITRLAGRGHVVHIAASDVRLAKAPPSDVIIHRYSLNYPRLHPFEAMFKIRRSFRSIHKQNKFDVIHQLNPVIPAMSGLLLNQGVPIALGPFVEAWPPEGKGSPLSPFDRGKRRVVTWINRAQQNAASALILVNRKASSALGIRDQLDGGIRVIPIGVDTRQFCPDTRERPHDPACPIILFLANLHVRKGIYTLLDAFERVSQSIPNCRLVVAGDGPERHGVRARVKGMSSSAMISLVGAIERARVPEIMRDCTVYCLPSYGDPFPHSALEAMACGKPVVVTDAGGLGDMVDDPRGGRKVPMRDASRLAEALIDLLTRQASEYDWESVITQLEQVYDEILRPPPSGGSNVPEASA
jgi:L-malate glycosyltransferase